MDLADDVAYSCFDIVDGWKARFLVPDRIESWRETNAKNPNEKKRLTDLQRKYLDELLEMMAKNTLTRKMNGIIGKLISSTSLAPTENFMSGQTRRHAYRLVRQPEAEARIDLHKALCKDLIFGSSALHQIEFKGGQILRKLAEALFTNYLGAAKPMALVPGDVHRSVTGAKNQKEAARLLCDHLSGMTDAYALRSYKRLLDPDYGSISELI
jgi:dGTPase